MTAYAAMNAAHDPEGHLAEWAVGGDDSAAPARDTVSIRWENEGFTLTGSLERERVEYVMRLSSTWQLRQFILFRDLEEPDLWLATDGAGRWGEMNGAHRVELDGCFDLTMSTSTTVTPFTATMPIRRLPLLDGHTADVPVVQVNPDTLEVLAVSLRYTRISARHWRIDTDDGQVAIELEVDEHGVVFDHPGLFRRLSPGR